jgi:hypothetical protein
LRRTIDVNRAGTALADAAAELGTPELQVIANDPQQWRSRITFERHLLGIDLE